MSLATLVLMSLVAADPVRTLEGEACVPWERIECHENRGVDFVQETFLPETEHLKKSVHGKGVVEAFDGDASPHSKYFLLHYGIKWKEATQPVPVLLLHGASSNATLSFAGKYFNGASGLMQSLSEQGYAVFAVTFPCGQGDLFFMREHVARAIEIVRERTGAKEVDVVAHSLGGVVARMLVTGMKLAKGRPYAGEVRRLVFVGTPHRGIDLTFRHPIAYQRFYQYGTPSPWTFYKPQGDVAAHSIYGGAYKAQLQILADLSGIIPLSQAEMDWYTTWHGGKGYASESKGIREAIRMGGDHIEKLGRMKFPRDVEVYVLAGKRNVVRYVALTGQQLEEPGEYDGPSDGILFVASAADEEGLKKAGARLLGIAVVEMNHVELLYLEEAKSRIESWLSGGQAQGK